MKDRFQSKRGSHPRYGLASRARCSAASLAIGSAKIGRVELGACDLGPGVDAAAAAGGWIPIFPSWQYFARREVGLSSRSEA